MHEFDSSLIHFNEDSSVHTVLAMEALRRQLNSKLQDQKTNKQNR